MKLKMGNTPNIELKLEKPIMIYTTISMEILLPSCIGSGIISILEKNGLERKLFNFHITINGIPLPSLEMEAEWEKSFTDVKIRKYESESDKEKTVNMWYKFISVRDEYKKYDDQAFRELMKFQHCPRLVAV